MVADSATDVVDVSLVKHPLIEGTHTARTLGLKTVQLPVCQLGVHACQAMCDDVISGEVSAQVQWDRKPGFQARPQMLEEPTAGFVVAGACPFEEQPGAGDVGGLRRTARVISIIGGGWMSSWVLRSLLEGVASLMELPARPSSIGRGNHFPANGLIAGAGPTGRCGRLSTGMSVRGVWMGQRCVRISRNPAIGYTLNREVTAGNR